MTTPLSRFTAGLAKQDTQPFDIFNASMMSGQWRLFDQTPVQERNGNGEEHGSQGEYVENG